MADEHHIPRTWHDASMEMEEFQALLEKHSTSQDAVDVWVRGERRDPTKGRNANPT